MRRMVEADEPRYAAEIRSLIEELNVTVEVISSPIDDGKLNSFSYHARDNDGSDKIIIGVSDLLNSEKRRAAILRELKSYRTLGEAVESVLTVEAIKSLLEETNGEETSRPVDLSIASVIIPETKTSEGTLIRATSLVWDDVVNLLREDWAAAYQIPAHLWEEIVAGAFVKDGFDEVTLTPRSGDFGRDVIAIKRGVGSIKVLGSVKAYKPGLNVSYDSIRALAGVLHAETNASKGIITTTSDFPPRVGEDKLLKGLMPYRLELMNGKALQKWLTDLAAKKR